MQVILKKKPKKVTLLEGFPGFGLIGTITTEFLLEHLRTEQIGRIVFDEMPAMIAIHDGKVVEPLGIFYNKKYHLVFLHAVTASQGMEWKLADAILDLAHQLQAKEIISLEGVGAGDGSILPTSKVFYYANRQSNKEKFEKAGVELLKEGIVIGVTGALVVRSEIPISAIFAETKTNLPDSKAAAKVIQVLDQYLDLDVDTKPLLAQAKQFEAKLQSMFAQGQKNQELSEKKRMSYVG